MKKLNLLIAASSFIVSTAHAEPYMGFSVSSVFSPDVSNQDTIEFPVDPGIGAGIIVGDDSFLTNRLDGRLELFYIKHPLHGYNDNTVVPKVEKSLDGKYLNTLNLSASFLLTQDVGKIDVKAGPTVGLSYMKLLGDEDVVPFVGGSIAVEFQANEDTKVGINYKYNVYSETEVKDKEFSYRYHGVFFTVTRRF